VFHARPRCVNYRVLFSLWHVRLLCPTEKDTTTQGIFSVVNRIVPHDR
jgi:hypothetical protein